MIDTWLNNGELGAAGVVRTCLLIAQPWFADRPTVRGSPTKQTNPDGTYDPDAENSLGLQNRIPSRRSCPIGQLANSSSANGMATSDRTSFITWAARPSQVVGGPTR